jgi:hypothetical protein
VSTDVAALAIKVESVGADQAQQQLDALTSSAGRTESATGLLESGFRRLTGALAGLLAAERVVTFFLSSAAAATRLQSSLTSAAGAMGFTTTQLRQMEDSARRLAAGTSFSAEQVGAAFAALAQDAGTLASTPQQLDAITAAAITLAQATRSDLNDAGETLITILRQFGGSASEVTNAITELGSTAPELQDVAGAFGAVGNAAAALGISVPETAAALKLLGDAGMEGAFAGTALRGVLLQLESASEANLRPSVVGLAEALRNAAGAQLEWSDRSFAASQVLVAGAGQLREITAGMQASNRAAELSAQTMETYEARAAELDARLGDLQATIGTAMLPALTEMAKAGTDLLTTWNDLAGIEDPFADKVSSVSTMSAAMSALSLGVAGTSIAIDRLSLAFTTMREKMAENLRGGPDLAERLAEVERRAQGAREALDKLTVDTIDRILYGPPTAPKAEEPKFEAERRDPGVVGAVAASESERARRERFTASDGQQFLSTAAMENAEDPLQRLRVSFEAELAAYEEQGVKLVQAGVLTEDQRQAAIMDRRRAHEQEMTRLMQEEQATRASTILSMEADISTNRYEAERLRLEASLIQRREMILQAVGGDEIAAATKINQLREAGYSRIEQQERDHNARLKALRANQWRENLAGAITGTGALLSLLSSSSEKGFRIQRVAALAQATLNAYTSASEAYKNALKDGGNPYAAAAMAGLASSAQFANVAALRGVSLGGGGGGGASMGGFGGSAAATVREQPFGDAPTVEVIRDSGTRTGVSVNVVNNLGGQAGVEVQESTGPSGETLVTLVVDAITQDIATSGRVAQTMQRRFGLNPRLGVRS